MGAPVRPAPAPWPRRVGYSPGRGPRDPRTPTAHSSVSDQSLADAPTGGWEQISPQQLSRLQPPGPPQGPCQRPRSRCHRFCRWPGRCHRQTNCTASPHCRRRRPRRRHPHRPGSSQGKPCTAHRGAADLEGVARLAGPGAVTAARAAEGTWGGWRLARAADTDAGTHIRDHCSSQGPPGSSDRRRRHCNSAAWCQVGGGPADHPVVYPLTRALGGAGLAGPTIATGRPTCPADLVAGPVSADPRLAGAGAAAAGRNSSEGVQTHCPSWQMVPVGQAAWQTPGSRGPALQQPSGQLWGVQTHSPPDCGGPCGRQICVLAQRWHASPSWPQKLASSPGRQRSPSQQPLAQVCAPQVAVP